MNQLESDKYLVRYCHPTRFDFEPYGSIWKAFGDNDTYTLYIQVSDNAEDTRWLTLSSFLEIVCHEFLKDTEFIEDSLKLFKINESKYFEEIGKKK